ncbi:MAG: hypothetical protein M5R41_03010 [Bacteroidia bacterium]|nr:hypothetical protein [Bacteroidia bacterium]
METLQWILTRLLAMNGLWILATVFFIAILLRALCGLILGSGACRSFLHEQDQQGGFDHA